MTLVQKIIGVIFCILLTLMFEVKAYGGMFGGIGHKHHSGGSGVASILAAGLIAKLISRNHNCYPYLRSRNNPYMFTHQNNAYLQNALIFQRYAFLQPRLETLQGKLSNFQPKVANLNPSTPYFQGNPNTQYHQNNPRAAYLQARLAYLRQRQALLYPTFPHHQPPADSRGVPFIPPGFLNKYFKYE